MKVETAKSLIEKSNFNWDTFKELLTQQNASLNEQIEGGDSFLHVLFKCDHKKHDLTDFLTNLLKTKLDINQLNNKEESCFDILCNNTRYDVDAITTQLILTGLDINRKNSAGNTYLHNLAQNLDYHGNSIALVLSKKMADPLTVNNEGDTFLHILFRTKSYYAKYVLEFIGNSTTNLNHVNKKGETCLDIILANPQYTSDEILQKLIKAGLDINRKDALGNSYLQKVPVLIDNNYENLASFLLPIMKTPFSTNKAGKSILDVWLAHVPDSHSSYYHSIILTTLIDLYIASLDSKEKMEILKSSSCHNKIKRCLLKCETLDFNFRDNDNNTVLNFGIDFLLSDHLMNGYLSFKKYFTLYASHGIDQYISAKNGEIPLFRILNSKLDLVCKDRILYDFFEVFKPDLKRKIENKAIFESIRIDDTLPNTVLKAIFSDETLLLEPLMLNKLQTYFEEQKKFDMMYQLIRLTTPDKKTLNDKLQVFENKFYSRDDSSDCLNTRLLGHKFSLKGKISYTSPDKKLTTEVTLTGSHNQEVMPNFYTSILGYESQVDSKTNTELKNTFASISEIVRKSLRYHILGTKLQDEKLKNEIFEQWLADCKQGISIFYTGYAGHTISLVIVGGKTLYRCNRGGCSTSNDIIEQYTINNPNELSVDMIKKFVLEDYRESNKLYLQKDIHQILGLTLVNVTKGKLQTVGNCGWANKKAGLRALIHALLTKSSKYSTKDELEKAVKITFKQWSSYDKNAFLDSYLKKYANHPALPYVLRRMICTHFDPDSVKDVELGTKVIKTLRELSRFEESYIEFLLTYWNLGLKDKKEQARFVVFLKKLNVDLSSLQASNLNFSTQTKLFLACVANDNKLVEEMVKITDLNELTYLGWNPLHIAVGNNNLPLVISLCQSHPTWVNMQNAFEETPIFFVENVDIAEKLILGGAILNMGEDNATPLNRAIEKTNVSLVDFLLKKGALPNDYSLNWAARYNSIVIAQLIVLSDKEKYLNSKTYNYQTAVHAASDLGHTDFLKYLISIGSDINEQDVNGNLPLHVAVTNGHDDTVIEIIQYPGAKIKMTNHQRKTAFDLVNIQKRDLKHQSEHTSMPNTSSSHDLFQFQSFANQSKLGLMNSPEEHFFCAIREGKLSAVETSLRLFPKLKINDNVEPFSINPLHEAILRGRKEIFDFLMKQPNIDINAASINNERPIHLAVSTHNRDMLNILLNRPGIKINEPGDFGYTPLHEAVERRNLPAVIALLARPDIILNIRSKTKKLAKELDIYDNHFSQQAIKLIEDREKELLKVNSDVKHNM